MDFSSPTAIALALIPKIPLMITTTVYHTLSLSPTSTTWDLKTELAIALIRAFLSPPRPRPILTQQSASLRDPGIKGPLHVAKTTFPPPPTPDLLHLLTTAIDSLKTTPNESYIPPTYAPALTAEWIAHNPTAPSSSTPRPPLPFERAHYDLLTSTLPTNPTTILYLHGGAFYLMDPATHRLPCARLSRHTSSRVLSLRYRLAPQHPFPSALLDTLHAYLTLLYPPASTFHAPVPANRIVIAGDSAGANLATALLQLLLTINRLNPASSAASFKFFDTDVPLPLPLPAGLALASPWLDLTRSLPSNISNARFDYLPPPLTPRTIALVPTDSVWPTDPPRGDLYCETSMLCHPLVSPLAARDWRGACPVWFGVGEEMLGDEARVVAGRMARQAVEGKGGVGWREWGGMCHCFGMILIWAQESKTFFEEEVDFIKNVVGNDKEFRTSGKVYEAKTLREREVNMEELAVWSDEEIREKMEKCRDAREEAWTRGLAKL